MNDAQDRPAEEEEFVTPYIPLQRKCPACGGDLWGKDLDQKATMVKDTTPFDGLTFTFYHPTCAPRS